MGKTVLTYNDIADINRYLKEAGVIYEVHMHDLCGSQSFSLRFTDVSGTEDIKVAIRYITSYFASKGMTLRFSEDGTDFVVL